MKKTVLITCMLYLAGASLMYGQGLTLLTTAGGFASNNDMHLSYSIGEPVIDYAPSGATWLTQGYQQPGHMEIMVSTDVSANVRHIQLFPNPATSEIFLAGIEPGACGLLRLYNTLGQPVLTAVVQDAQPRINVEGLRPGRYYVSLQCNALQFHTTSFIKL